MSAIVRKNEVMEVRIDELLENALSANEEDSVTFERLKKEVSTWGLLDLPVVRPLSEDEAASYPGKRYRIVHGRHRIAAMRDMGCETAQVVVMARPPETPEEEFNLVNNMNLIRGDTTARNLVKIIRRDNLDVTKIDLFKHPVKQLIPDAIATIKDRESEAKRNAAINKLTLEIAKEIAKQMVDEKDDLLTFLVVKDRIAAVVRIPKGNATRARKVAPYLRSRMIELVNDVISREPDEEMETDEGEDSAECEDSE
ncbi:MAG TPA: ParB N-terminal domain-containing protein [Methanothrix sp.]|nr:ParB N-terminal domain-containing protein [Methanothrix sp.]HOK59125.1 ParB N-terminal domain-containing protein [Methanothrix sp.]HOL44388.1 ParB N-terminal domain-containing protein [Methanothrix sp.]HPO89403.1 ParB N-terminal domain-containing protein [Methanothrix sp.]